MTIYHRTHFAGAFWCGSDSLCIFSRDHIRTGDVVLLPRERHHDRYRITDVRTPIDPGDQHFTTVALEGHASEADLRACLSGEPLPIARDARQGRTLATWNGALRWVDDIDLMMAGPLWALAWNRGKPAT